MYSNVYIMIRLKISIEYNCIYYDIVVMYVFQLHKIDSKKKYIKELYGTGTLYIIILYSVSITDQTNQGISCSYNM